MDGGTWRRLKTALELRGGGGIPKLPPGDKELLFGLLSAIDAGRGAEAVRDVEIQRELGRRGSLSGKAFDEAIRELAARVDVRPFL